MILDAVHQEPPAHVDHFDEGKVPEGKQESRDGGRIQLVRLIFTIVVFHEKNSTSHPLWSINCCVLKMSNMSN